ncbi:UbiA family prenyltransferase [Curtobacterium flaccumfaciens pv. flaccumfaciens]|uniref:UbiA family prenyltransferase n=1 Tax=Curtobacterium TaxID=2034 RepID=UPI0008F8E737|nr:MULTISPECIES: UbiA family prenyltransferase [Curtobacterium]MBO9048072.1 UbiA family prenyltransferase [Curtobacterium flaccumfaciens pv. flaccumfaciens]MBO9058305.1 UbiA family prenyltransferase [Curtobacterium flaccumfaciens pv. flaccumfaciens]OII29048.1 1,4-dihydroxy-2-naphthoate prenyltransferase [Curtobacterium sp. MMLR14_002]OII45942.1 1,4-dihydroxy-2-naphthoate prenyltransferase [Curtobacterium sp. MMLR14_014]QTR90150.1 UbiA family prenyltransferase [Curtobacterium flaccumfaciens pv.
MTASRTPSTARLLFASSHPGPTVTVTVLAAVIAAAVGHPVWLVVLVALTVVAGQLSIGLANDWIDADRDRAVGRSDKPVARGLIAVGTVRAAAYATAGAAVVLSLFLGPVAAVAHLVLVAAGWAYDAGLKRSVWSVAPFVVAFGLLPVVSVAAGPEGQWPAWWAIATGAVFGIAIHCTNVLPDLVDDAATGVRGFPHRLGLRGAGIVAFASLVVAAALVLGGQVLGDDPVQGLGVVLAVLGAVVVAVLAVVGVRLVLAGRASRTLFRLVIASSLVLVVELGFAGARLVA